MTIHKSKGLEFPIVVVPDLGKKFNLTDLLGEIILDPELGICGKVRVPDTPQAYPSLPFWLAKKKQTIESLSEELRILYVAMTRAQDRLILAATSSEARAESWSQRSRDYNDPGRMQQARSCIDWLGPWLSAHAPLNWLEIGEGTTSTWCWRIIRHVESDDVTTLPERQPDEPGMNVTECEELLARLQWTYPHLDAARQAAKSSVTMLRRESAEELEAETPFSFKRQFRPTADAADPVEAGVAHHRFLQSVDLSKVAQPDGCNDEVGRLVEAGLLSPQQASMLDVPSIARFWNSELGRNILDCARSIRREIEFTARLTRETNPRMEVLSRIPDGEFIVVQGAVDLAVILPNEIWIVDFKTDDVRGKELDARAAQYSVQLRLYAAALGQIYGKPVTQKWLHFLKTGRTVAC